MAIFGGETIRFKVTVKDFDGNLADVSSNTVKIYSPSGELKQTFSSATRVSTGVYYVDYTLPTDADVGVWKCVWTVVLDGAYGIQTKTFEVKSA